MKQNTPAASRFFKKAFRFNGYAYRSEYCWVYLAYMLYLFGGAVLIGIFFGKEFQESSPYSYQSEEPSALAVAVLLIWVLAIFVFVIPYISLSVRRLHDMGCSGWFYLFILIPGIGGIIMLIMMATPTKMQARRPEWDDLRP